MERTSKGLVVVFLAGMILGILTSYAFIHDSGPSPEVRTCPIVNHEVLMEYLVRASPTAGGEATAKAVESAYLEQRSPNYPLELFREMYRDVPGRKEFLGLSYIFSNDTLSYGKFTLTNETPPRFEFASPAPGMSQRVDGAGIIASRWAVIFVSLYDFGGMNEVEELYLTVPEGWKLEYYGGTGDLLPGTVLRVRFSSTKRNNYVVLAFSTGGVLDPLDLEVTVNGDTYRLVHSSST
ncbi:hypothetical protein [Thermococcus pacificus]|uniref:Uncharacterized protein n=1 Tax=Thermococcus pacificus TaxID=71998 RepID=A0A218P9P5_9EURY|nr:hypothetical protein [Thermococcus pacificus]ASJ07460.1 hypothetical protein A3L08_09075 [Thermococcus pacificus]